jgi:hypothetical protein
MSIWVFDKHGIATVWKIDRGRDERLHRRWVMRDGTIRESDRDGDFEMLDARSPSPGILQRPVPSTQESYDGAARFSPIVPSNPVYDSEGDLLMEELTTEKSESEGEENYGQQIVAEIWYHRERWARRFLRRPVADLVEEVTGVSRIDVEIR